MKGFAKFFFLIFFEFSFFLMPYKTVTVFSKFILKAKQKKTRICSRL